LFLLKKLYIYCTLYYAMLHRLEKPIIKFCIEKLIIKAKGINLRVPFLWKSYNARTKVLIMHSHLSFNLPLMSFLLHRYYILQYMLTLFACKWIIEQYFLYKNKIFLFKSAMFQPTQCYYKCTLFLIHGT